jgi:hypothetical protein
MAAVFWFWGGRRAGYIDTGLKIENLPVGGKRIGKTASGSLISAEAVRSVSEIRARVARRERLHGTLGRVGGGEEDGRRALPCAPPSSPCTGDLVVLRWKYPLIPAGLDRPAGGTPSSLPGFCRLQV